MVAIPRRCIDPSDGKFLWSFSKCSAFLGLVAGVLRPRAASLWFCTRREPRRLDPAHSDAIICRSSGNIWCFPRSERRNSLHELISNCGEVVDCVCTTSLAPGFREKEPQFRTIARVLLCQTVQKMRIHVASSFFRPVGFVELCGFLFTSIVSRTLSFFHIQHLSSEFCVQPPSKLSRCQKFQCASK